MKFVLVVSALALLSACTQTRLALHPSQCTAPTASEAQLTKSVWMPKQKRVRQ